MARLSSSQWASIMECQYFDSFLIGKRVAIHAVLNFIGFMHKWKESDVINRAMVENKNRSEVHINIAANKNLRMN